MSNSIVVEDIGRNLLIRFNRPESRSPLSIEVIERVATLLTDVDAYIERVIFTGVGDVFASGADLREIAGVDGTSAVAFAGRGQDLMRQITELRPETIAAVNGLCFGGALDLALACDRRIASPMAVFSHPGANLGIMTGWGGTQRLPRLVGEAVALEMFFTARRMPAEEALRRGLIDEIVDDPVKRALDA